MYATLIQLTAQNSLSLLWFSRKDDILPELSGAKGAILELEVLQDLAGAHQMQQGWPIQLIHVAEVQHSVHRQEIREI